MNPDELTDEQLLDELAATDDSDELLVLRAAAAQRGLHIAALKIPPAERRRIAEEAGGAS